MLYNFARLILKAFYKLLFFIKFEGTDNIPLDGGVLLCSNHKHFYDPLLVVAATKRKLRFLAKIELFKPGICNYFLKASGCIPVDRSGGELKALKTCINVLNNENALLMYPEGTRHCKHIADVKYGAILFAIKSQKPIIPVGVSKLKLFSKTIVRIGKPIYYNDYYNKKLSSEEYSKLISELMYEIYSMVDGNGCYFDEIKACVNNEN